MSYLPDSDEGKDEFLASLSAKLPGYAATFGLAPEEIASVPDYTDARELPSAPSPGKYLAIYRLRDERIGQWSDSAQITVHS